MNRFFNFKKKIENLGRPFVEVAAMSGAAMLLVLAAVFISQGGMAKVNHVLALYGITPESQTGCIFPCNNTAYTMEALIPLQNGSIVSSVAPGTNVNWQWNAGSYGANYFTPVCRGGIYGPGYVCTVQRDTPNLNFGACQPAYTTGGECNSYTCMGWDKFGICNLETCNGWNPTVQHPPVNCGNADDYYGNACFGPSGGTTMTGWQPGCSNGGSGGAGYDGNYPASTVTLTAPSTPGNYTYYFCSNWLINYAPQGRLGCLGTILTVVTPPTPPTMSASPQRVTYGSASTLTWASNNQPAGTYCRVYSGVGLDNPGTGSGTLFQDGDTTGNYSASKSTGPLTRTWSYDLYCSNGQNAMTTVYVDPSITASPAIVSSGQSSTIAWHAGDQTPGTNCRVYAAEESTTNPALLSSGYWTFDSGNYIGSKSTGPLTQTTSYGIYCPDGAVDGPQGYQTNWVTVGVGTPPSCSIAASPSTVANSGDRATLNYSYTGATSASIDQGVGAVSATVQRATFTTSGSWVAPAGVTSVDYLVVAGGGGGGSGYGGGGGGAGGVLTGTLAVTPGNSYTVTVGAGGAGASGSLNSGYGGLGGHGASSVFDSITAIGGGGGAYGGGASGGSGGGGGGNGGAGGGAGTAGQGNNGGAAVAGPVNYGGGGGGGKGSAGSQAPSSKNGGAGGTGYASSISGTSRVYAAGGGGGGEGGTGGAGGSSNTGGHGGGGAGNVGITSPTYYGSGGGGGGSSAGWASGTAGYQGIVILSYISGSVQSSPVTTTPTTFTMTVTDSTSGLSGTCSVPVAITDVCTDISGFQSAAPPAPCVTPVPSPGQCIPSGYTHNGSTCVPSAASISGFTGPARVRKGTTATLMYTVTNPPATCTIVGTNGFSTTTGPNNGVQSPPVTTNAITANTTFTLMCGTVSRSATVGITPEFQEI